ncbi:hypothetical protein AB0B54_31560, partial [Microbispora bryophytorum]|uniref:hypothetical protein n=1 Tax=Microbispora bryophytorum TaxID=1460882 RepID=UPI003401DECB
MVPETLIVLVTACEPFALGQPDGDVGLPVGVGDGLLVGVTVGVEDGWDPAGWSDHCLVDT